MVRLSNCVYLVAIHAILDCLSCHFNLVVVFVHVISTCVLSFWYTLTGRFWLKCLWQFSKIFTYYALHASHYACIMFQHEQPWCKHFIAWIFYCSIYDTKISDSIYAFQCMLNALLEHIELFNTTVYFNVHWLFY